MSKTRTIWIGRYGQIAEDYPYVCAPKPLSFLAKRKKPRPISYREVIEFLYDIKNNAQPNEEILVHHSSNHDYPNHKIPYNFPCIDTIDQAIAFVIQRQQDETNNKWRQVGKLLNEFEHNINNFAEKGGHAEIVSILTNLKKCLQSDIIADRCYKPKREITDHDEEPEYNGPDLNKTYYPMIIKHFTQLTKQFIANPQGITKEEIEKSATNLEKKLNAQSISVKLRSLISAAFTALLGLAIGAVIGGLTSGGIGAIPGAIIGATAGAAIGFTGGGLFGLFHARRHNNIIEARKNKFQISDENGRRLAEPENKAREAFARLKNTLTK